MINVLNLVFLFTSILNGSGYLISRNNFLKGVTSYAVSIQTTPENDNNKSDYSLSYRRHDDSLETDTTSSETALGLK